MELHLPGSVSPVTKGRARSTGPVVHRSRVDMVKTPDQRSKDDTNKDRASTTTRTRVNKDLTGAAAKSQKLARVKSMPSKLNTESKNSPAVSSSTPKTVHLNSETLSRARTQSLKRLSQSHNAPADGTPTSAKSMPNPPKAMTPRSVPREPKALKDVTTANKASTPGKVICFTFHLILRACVFSDLRFSICILNAVVT
jgi:hypothetical protein